MRKLRHSEIQSLTQSHRAGISNTAFSDYPSLPLQGPTLGRGCIGQSSKYEGVGLAPEMGRRGKLKGPWEQKTELGNRFSVKDSASFYSLSCPAFRANGPTNAKLKLLLGLESVLRKSGQPQ